VHYFALFLVVPEAVVLLTDRRVPGRRRMAAGAGIGVPALGLFVLARTQSARSYYFNHAPLGIRVEQIPKFFIAGFTPPAGRLAFALAGAGMLTGAALLALRAAPHERRGALLAGALGLAAVIAPVLLALGGADYLHARNVILALVPLLIAVAAGLTARRAGVLGAAAAVAVVAVSVAMVAKVQSDPGAQRPQWQQVAKLLAFSGEPRAIVLLGPHTWSRILGFYLRDAWWDPPHGRRVAEIDVLRKAASDGPCPAHVWWGASCDSHPHPPPIGSPARGFRFASAARVAGFAIDRYVSARPIRVYAHPPFERLTSLDLRTSYRHRGRLMVMPRSAPALP
jgi:MFS family permease